MYQFEWDARKAAANYAKHGVTFEEAQTVFFNALAVIFADDRHSVGERRELILGHSLRHRLLLVCFTEHDERIRVISARRATPRERQDYEENRRN